MTEGADAAVIELGSSDEETTHPPLKKPRPTANAMVCIPSVNLPKGITVKPKSKILGINPMAKAKPIAAQKFSNGSAQLRPQKVVPVKLNDPGMQQRKITPNASKVVGKKIQNAPFTSLRISPGAKITNGPINVVSASDMAKAKQILMRVQNEFKTKKQHNQVRPVRPVCVVGSSVSLKSKGPIVAGNRHIGPPVFFPPPSHPPSILPIVTPRIANINTLINNHTKQKNPKLPPGITVKKVMGSQVSQPVKRPAETGPTMIIKKKRRINPLAAVEVPLVELDDDDEPTPEPSPAGPQWYVRPNDEDKTTGSDKEPETTEIDANGNEGSKIETHMQTINNKEPETEMIEITIEDSPIKPPPAPSVKMASDLSIIIEDSPQKSKDDTEKSSHVQQKNKSPKSKKSLNFPQNTSFIEVEVEFTPVSDALADAENSTKLAKENVVSVDTDENATPNDDQVSDSSSEGANKKKTLKNKGENDSKRTKRTQKSSNEPKATSPASPKTTSSMSDSSLAEFNENYREFIQLCLEMENSEDMNKILEKKVKEYYRQVDKSYTESDDFKKLVSAKVKDIRSSPHNLYLFIKDVVDELKIRRKSKNRSNEFKSCENINETETVKDVGEKENMSNIPQVEESVEGAEQTNRNIRKLEKTLRKLHRAIQKLEEQEVDFDDENDSAYLLTERYKERMVRVHAKLCQLTGTKMPSEARVTVDVRPGRPQGPTLRLEKRINKKVPVGAPLPFPDFHDVLKCVREANEEDKLGWSEMEIMEEARDLFARCGKRLQKRRQKNEWRIAASRLGDARDPAEESPELQEKLRKNKEIATTSENRVINKYADRQNTLKLEPKEIGDNDIEESAPSSDDEVQAVEDEIIPISSKMVFSPIKIKRSEPAATETVNAETESKETHAQDNDNLVTITLEDKESNSNDPMDVDVREDSEVAQNETEQLTLAISDENTANSVEADVKVRSDKGNISEKDTDTDAPIALSDTQESDDNTDKVETCDVVSIEDSSTSDDGSDQDKESDINESGEEIDDADDDGGNVITSGDDEIQCKDTEGQHSDDKSVNHTTAAKKCDAEDGLETVITLGDDETQSKDTDIQQIDDESIDSNGEANKCVELDGGENVITSEDDEIQSKDKDVQQTNKESNNYNMVTNKSDSEDSGANVITSGDDEMPSKDTNAQQIDDESVEATKEPKKSGAEHDRATITFGDDEKQAKRTEVPQIYNDSVDVSETANTIYSKDHVADVITSGEDDLRFQGTRGQKIDDESFSSEEAKNNLKSDDEFNIKLIDEIEESRIAAAVTESGEVITFGMPSSLNNDAPDTKEPATMQTNDAHLGITDANGVNEKLNVNATSLESDPEASVKNISYNASNFDEITSDEDTSRPVIHKEVSGENQKSDGLRTGPTVIQVFDMLESGYEVSSSARSTHDEELIDTVNAKDSKRIIYNTDTIGDNNTDSIDRQMKEIFDIGCNKSVEQNKLQSVNVVEENDDIKTVNTKSHDITEILQLDKVCFKQHYTVEETAIHSENVANDNFQAISNDKLSRDEMDIVRDEVFNEDLDCSDETAGILNDIDSMEVDAEQKVGQIEEQSEVASSVVGAVE